MSSFTANLAGTANDLIITGTVGNAMGYNPAGQIINQSRSNDSYSWTGSVAVNRNYATNGLNQYTAAGAAGFAYDANGNLITEPGVTYTYDVENRLVGASGTKIASLVYDPMGRLFQVTGATTNTRFLYDGDELVAEYDSAGTMARRYVHSDNADDPVVQYDGASVGAAARTYLMPDERGSIAGLFRSDGTVAKNTYDEYGIPGSANVGRFQYTGQIWLPELGMYHYKARIYSPTLGRFLQVDPIGYDGQVNLYAYVANDPVNKSDPDGRAAVLGVAIGLGIEAFSQANSAEDRQAYRESYEQLRNGNILDALDTAKSQLGRLALAGAVGAVGGNLNVGAKIGKAELSAVKAERARQAAQAAKARGAKAASQARRASQAARLDRQTGQARTSAAGAAAAVGVLKVSQKGAEEAIKRRQEHVEKEPKQ